MSAHGNAIPSVVMVPGEGAGPLSDHDPGVTILRPSSGWTSLKLRNLWEYRELLYFLIWRDIKVRYKQTVLGAAWAIVQPLSTMVVFSLFFGKLAHMPSDGVPYPLFSLAALVPWTFFANGLGQAAGSVVGSQQLVTKVYFPRLTIPLATVLAGLLDLAIALLVLLGMMLYFGRLPTATALWIGPLSCLAVAAALGVGLWLAALNVQYRDVKYVVPFLTQLWLFATPVAYPTSLLAPRWRSVYALNPMVGVVEGFRWALVGTGPAPWTLIAVSSAASLLLLASGALYFRRMERTFADVV